MAERLWSGPGCDGNADFEFVKYSDSGVALYRKIGDATVHLKTAGGYTHIIKHDTQKKETGPMPNISQAVAKALCPDLTDTPAEAERKALLLAQVAKGVLSIDALAAEVTLESMAKSAHSADPSKSFEAHYAETFAKNETLARVALGTPAPGASGYTPAEERELQKMADAIRS